MTDSSKVAEPPEDPERRSFRQAVRNFLAAESKPLSQASPWSVNFHVEPSEAQRAFDEGRAWQKTRYRAGMTGFTYPKKYGGQGGEAWQEEIYQEEARLYGSSSGFIASTIAMLGPTLMAYGTEEQKRDLIPRLLSGDDAWCQLFSEPGSGSDLASLGCRVWRDGDEFVISGQKVWNSAAQWCDHGFLLGRTNPDVPKHRGITMLLIDMGSPGVEVRPLVQATGAAHFNEVFLNEVRVPAANVLGEVDAGWGPARTVLSNEAAMIGSGPIRTYPTLLLLAELNAVRHDQVIRQGLADFYSRERVLELMSERIMVKVRQRQPPPIDPAVLKLSYTEKRVRSGDLAMAIAGASGMIDDDGPTRWVAAECVGRYSVSIGGGTTEVQKNNLAERALGLPRDLTGDRDVPWKEVLHNSASRRP